MSAALAMAPDRLRTAELIVPASAAARRAPASAAGRRAPASAAGRRLPGSAAGRRLPASAARGRLPASTAADTGRHQAQRVRLSRRGRVVGAVGAALTVVAVCSTLLDAASAAAPPRTVTVQSGQTLSEIARRELPDLPTREAVARLQLANALSSSEVHAGQVLQIPADG